MSERADSEPRNHVEESPSELDINPRPPRPARVSRRAAGAVIVVGVIILALFAYGGYKRQQRQVAALAERGSPRSVAPATAAGAEIARAVPAGARLETPAAGGKLVAPGEPTPTRIAPPTSARPSRSGAAAGSTAPMTPAREPSSEERWLVAAYEAEQQAMTAPTAHRGVAAAQSAPLASTPSIAPNLTAAAEPTSALSSLVQSLAAGGQRASSDRLLRAGTPDGNPQEGPPSDREDFLTRARAARAASYLNATRTTRLSRYEIKAGWDIPAVLEQGLNSDLPGELKALVASNVYDSVSGQYLLIPQGSRLLGVYDSRVSYGQEGAQVVWNRLIYPDGSSLELGGMVGQDADGTAGFRGKVDRHYRRLVGFAVLTSLFAAGSALAQSRNRTLLTYPSPGEIAAGAIGQEVAAVGAQVTRRNLNVQPTIRVPVGYRFTVRVNRDILFEAPYSSMDEAH